MISRRAHSGCRSKTHSHRLLFIGPRRSCLSLVRLQFQTQISRPFSSSLQQLTSVLLLPQFLLFSLPPPFSLIYVETDLPPSIGHNLSRVGDTVEFCCCFAVISRIVKCLAFDVEYCSSNKSC
ncbi:unnamed protein product [Citrullus colocynthis]|uniref:Uncharacterized protein n=1 Tax=Citrullus colocynthis TaxID=252529 RepID=A0ABP0YMA9_9ROSI